jgi:uncharacterized protein YukE
MPVIREREAILAHIDAMLSSDSERMWCAAISIAAHHYLVPPERLAVALFNTVSPRRGDKLTADIMAIVETMSPIMRNILANNLEELIGSWTGKATKPYHAIIERIRPIKADYERELAECQAAVHLATSDRQPSTPSHHRPGC